MRTIVRGSKAACLPGSARRYPVYPKPQSDASSEGDNSFRFFLMVRKTAAGNPDDGLTYAGSRRGAVPQIAPGARACSPPAQNPREVPVRLTGAW